MKFTYNWLRRHLNTTASPKEIADKLTVIGLEIEDMDDKLSSLNDFIIAKVIDAQNHPNADKLKLLTVDTGKEHLQIVCGAPNARAGIFGILALPGVIIPSTGEKLKISKIRGIESNGMMCAEDELGLSNLHESIIELPDDIIASVQPGDPAIKALDKIYNLDVVFDGEITSNRADYLGVKGIALDLQASNVGNVIEEKIEKPQSEIKNPIKVNLETDLSSVFAGIYIKNVNIAPSPKWLKDLLLSVGINPINAVVDISNFICYDMNRPLHIFDADKIVDNILTVRKSKPGETISALNDKVYELSNSDIVVSSGKDSENIESIAGVIGGKRSCVTDNTKNIFIESALFNNVSIRKTSTRLGIITDSKYRFERFVSPSTVLPGLYKAANLIKEICGGQISDVIISGKIDDNRKNILYPIDHFKQRIGVDIPVDKMIDILERLGFKVDQQGDNLNLITPDHRGDLNTKYDVTEEIIRIYGYDKIPLLPVKKTDLINQNLSDFKKSISLAKKTLCANGMMEIYTMMFGNSQKQSPFVSDTELVKLLNPISSDLDCMRVSLIPNILNALKNNLAYGNSDLSMFECGYVFDGNNPGEEHLNIAGIRSGFAIPKNWLKRERLSDVFDVKSDLLSVINSLNIDVIKLRILSDADKLPSYLNPFKSGIVIYKNKTIGCFGEVHPLILKDYGIKNLPVFCFELYFSQLPEIEYNKHTTKGKFIVNNFQKIVRDLSFVLDKKIKAKELVDCIKKTNINLIKNIYIFDVYENTASFGDDRRSIALTITFQPENKTLTDSEINNIMQTIIDSVDKNLHGILLKDFVKS